MMKYTLFSNIFISSRKWNILVGNHRPHKKLFRRHCEIQYLGNLSFPYNAKINDLFLPRGPTGCFIAMFLLLSNEGWAVFAADLCWLALFLKVWWAPFSGGPQGIALMPIGSVRPWWGGCLDLSFPCIWAGLNSLDWLQTSFSGFLNISLLLGP